MISAFLATGAAGVHAGPGRARSAVPLTHPLTHSLSLTHTQFSGGLTVPYAMWGVPLSLSLTHTLTRTHTQQVQQVYMQVPASQMQQAPSYQPAPAPSYQVPVPTEPLLNPSTHQIRRLCRIGWLLPYRGTSLIRKCPPKDFRRAIGLLYGPLLPARPRRDERPFIPGRCPYLWTEPAGGGASLLDGLEFGGAGLRVVRRSWD